MNATMGSPRVFRTTATGSTIPSQEVGPHLLSKMGAPMVAVLPMTLAVCLLGLCWEGSCPAAEAPRPTVGAIRWDAWAGGGGVTRIMERTLGPQRYHHRLPWFAKVTGTDTVRIAGGAQAIIDREIAFAADAGLDYWAFLMSMGNGLPSASLQSLRMSRSLRSRTTPWAGCSTAT